jgi:hypothetical protein
MLWLLWQTMKDALLLGSVLANGCILCAPFPPLWKRKA